MSQLFVDNIKNRTGGAIGAPAGAVVTGVVTATTFSGNVTGVAATFTGNATAASLSIDDKIIHTGDTNTAIRFPAADTFTVETGGSEAIRVDSSGRLLVGTTSSSQNATIVAQGNSDSATSSAELYMQRGQSSPNDGATFATIAFGDSGGGQGAAILSQRDGGTWSGSSKPGRLIFSTTSDGASSPTERLRVTSAGRFGVNTTSPDYTVDINGELGITEGQPVTWHDGSGNAAAQIYGDSSSNLIFRTGVAGMGERMRLLPAGGLTFNGDTAAANALDDYEEGTWTPSIGGNATYTNQVGTYVKVGRMVYAQWALTINAQGTGSNISAISGLPYPSGVASQVTSNLLWGGFGVSMAYAVYYVGNASTTMNLSYIATAATALTNNPNGLVNGATVNGTIVYYST